MRLKFLREGAKFSIWGIDLGDGTIEDCPALNFISGLNKIEQGKVLQLLKLHADHGPIMNHRSLACYVMAFTSSSRVATEYFGSI